MGSSPFAPIPTATVELLEQFPGAPDCAGSDAGRHPSGTEYSIGKGVCGACSECLLEGPVPCVSGSAGRWVRGPQILAPLREDRERHPVAGASNLLAENNNWRTQRQLI